MEYVDLEHRNLPQLALVRKHGRGVLWVVLSRGWVEQRHLGGTVGLGGGGSQKDLPGLEVPGKSTLVVQVLSQV